MKSTKTNLLCMANRFLSLNRPPDLNSLSSYPSFLVLFFFSLFSIERISPSFLEVHLLPRSSSCSSYLLKIYNAQISISRQPMKIERQEQHILLPHSNWGVSYADSLNPTILPSCLFFLFLFSNQFWVWGKVCHERIWYGEAEREKLTREEKRDDSWY